VNNTVRWTLCTLLLVANAIVGVISRDTWYQIVIGAVTAACVIGLVIDYFVRGRRTTEGGGSPTRVRGGRTNDVSGLDQ
jgi:hypothetical protein